MSAHPGIGEWYRIRGGHQFEVVAVDDDDGTIEVQYSDGAIEELELSDWEVQYADGEIESVKSPDGWHGPSDFDHDGGDSDFALNNHFDSGSHVGGGLDGLDLFDGGDSFNFR